jgi:endonuclease YncB( thermonuclease family)
MKTCLWFILAVLVVAAHGEDRQFPAQVLKVHDGDTFTVSIDLGFGLTKLETVRLNGVDAPEIKTPEGKEARAYLTALIVGKPVLLLVNPKKEREKYGRLLVHVLVGETDLTEKIIKDGHGKEYHGGAR